MRNDIVNPRVAALDALDPALVEFSDVPDVELRNSEAPRKDVYMPKRRSDGAPEGRLLRQSARSLELPDVGKLFELLRFHPEDGSIRLGGARMTLVHVQALANLRRELIESFGVETARGLLTRMGYAAGSQDAELALRARSEGDLFEALTVGFRAQSLEGTLRVEPISIDYDPQRGLLDAEVLWWNSIEVECHLQTYGPSVEPVCWVQAGYASGYGTVFVGKPVLCREVECRGTGAQRCRVIGRTVDQWGEDVPDLRFLRQRVSLDLPRQDDVVSITGAPPQPIGVSDPDAIVGASPSFHATCNQVRRVASTRATVLFSGETGVGKEMFARFLHHESPRAAAPFVAVNCAAIPQTLLEPELFGVEKGAFTGAVASRPGRFERANGGTLFLDEVGALDLASQAKLLRALQSGEIERVGDVRTRNVDVRVVAATNEDLDAKVRNGGFRSDLYYRLNVFPVHIPPLRDRRDDIPILVDFMLRRYCAMYGRRIPGLTERAITALLDYDYPGNVRQLENMVERAVILAEDEAPLDFHLLFSSVRFADRPAFTVDRKGRVGLAPDSRAEAMAQQIIESHLPLELLVTKVMEEAATAAGGNLAGAARLIGVTRNQVAYRLQKSRMRGAEGSRRRP